MGNIYVFAGDDGWWQTDNMDAHNADEIAALCGTLFVPTPFRTTMDGAEVVQRLRALNPSNRVDLVDASGDVINID